MHIIENYLPRTEFESYEDFKANFSINIPEDFDFARDVVDLWAKQSPEKKALVYCDDSGFEKILTFADVSRLSKKAATYYAGLGICPGDRVLTLLRRRWEYWITAVALHRLGAVVVPASIQLTEKDIAYRVNACRASAVAAIDDPFVNSQIAGLFDICPTLEHIITVSDEPNAGENNFTARFEKCPEWQGYSGRSNDDEFIIYFTSGTSGYPKMAIHNRRYPLGHIVTAKYMQCVQNDGLHLTQSDSGWAKFGWGNIYGQWICGTAVLAYDPLRFDPKRLMAVMEKYRPTSLCIPPTMYRFLLHNGLEKRHVESIKWFSTAGEPLSGEVNRQFYALTGSYIHEGYGQSEGTPITCSFQWDDIRPSSMGKPSPLYDTAIIDQNGNRCGIGEKGEVVIFVHDRKPIGLLQSYCSDGETRNPYADGVYHTGDMAYADEDGFYWFVSRNDDMIKCSGYRIGPFEIESVLNTHPAVKESAIVGRPDEIRGQVVCAVIALKPGFSPSPELTRELQDYVKKNTAPYKYPRIVEYTDALPKTTSGKIMRGPLKTGAFPSKVTA